MEKKYLAIDEYGNSSIWPEFSDNLHNAADDGMYDVYDITDNENVMRYGETGWVAVEEIGE